MALTTLLEIVTRACDEMGLQRPTTVYGSTTFQDRQMLGLLQSAGRDLMEHHQWSTLVTTASVTLATASASYALPTDFHRLVDSAAWDRTQQFSVVGGITPQRHQYWLSSGQAAPQTFKEFRLNVRLGATTIYIHPEPTTTDSLHFLYVRNTWALNGSTPIEEFASDAHTSVFNPQLMVKELKWRFRAAKGLDATDLIFERNAMLERLVAADVAAPPIDMGGDYPRDPLDIVPDSDWTALP
jgi:hypothetical protein